jgi:hypothetical protein
VTDAEIDDELGKLFATPPAGFVKARTAVVKALKAAGRRDEAAGVEKLPRPSASVWAVNQLPRQAPALLRRLVEATERLRTGDHAGYAGAMAEHREALKALRFEAERILETAALRSTPELLARVAHDLRAGLLYPETRPLVERGRLVRDVAEDDVLSPFAQELPSRSPASPANDDDKGKAEQAKAREAARLARERRRQQLREAVAAAEAKRERAEAEVEAARRALAAAEERLTVAARAVADATAALDAASEE